MIVDELRYSYTHRGAHILRHVMIVAWFKAEMEYPLEMIFLRLALEDPIASCAFRIHGDDIT